MSKIQATKERSLFRMSVAVSADILAPSARVWGLLTSVSEQRTWNSTLLEIDGDIAEGKVVKLKAKASPDREFSLKVSQVVANESMAWCDGMAPMFKGVRTFRLAAIEGGVRFEMSEVFTGLMLPMIAGSLPDFVPVFETYAADLKRAAETQA